MDANLNEDDKEVLLARIQQLEHERNELRKDIEQLCVQQAGPSYLVVATRMHFQRTASLEQEIESLNKKLAGCTRDILNLQEELSEAYRIKGQLADLHRVESEKNMEAEKQLKFFQGCVAAAFAERDQAIMEAEKAKDKEEIMSQKFNDIEKRLEELTSACLEQKRLNDELQAHLAKQEGQNESFKKVVDKFFEIRQNSLHGHEDTSWDDKCACLLHDSTEMWCYNDTSTSKYISVLEEKLEMARISVDNLRNKLHVGLEIENHLKKRVHELEKKQILAYKMIMNQIAELQQAHSQHRGDIRNLLDEGKFHMESVINMVEEKIRLFAVGREQNLGPCEGVSNADENECRDVHITMDADSMLSSKSNAHSSPDILVDREGNVSEVLSQALQEKSNAHSSPDILVDREGNVSEVLSQALQEKVAALLLLSQQEERHLLERNVNAALQKKIEELQRNLLQVTNEKVKALMELARLKQEYQQLQEKTSHEIRQGNVLADSRDKGIFNHEHRKLRNLLNKTYLKRWIGGLDSSGNESEAYLNTEVNFFGRRSNNVDFARMKIENVALKESMENMEHLIKSIHRLRLALLKVKESVSCEGTIAGTAEVLNDIIYEAKLVRTALSSSLPISWSAGADDVPTSEIIPGDEGDVHGDPSNEKIDAVSSAGFEMVELLVLAAQILKDNLEKSTAELKEVLSHSACRP